MFIMKKETIINYCRTCDHDNTHKVFHLEQVEGEDEIYRTSADFMLLSCMGCHTFSYRTDFNDYEVAYPTEDGQWEHEITTTIYPLSLRGHKRLDNLRYLPVPIRTVYEEAINALIADCKILSGAGFRAVIEAICLDKDIKGRNLEVKINNLAKDGFITKKESERLHSIRFLGNDSIHEMMVPEKKQLMVVLNTIDNILSNIYLIDLDVDQNLERPINDYRSFIKLLDSKLKMFKTGDEFPLAIFLDRSARRVKDKFIDFETELKSEIASTQYVKLQLGGLQPYGVSTSNVQHYIVV